MTRIAVFSDSHGDTSALDRLLSQMGRIDAAFFLGDISSDAEYLRKRLEKYPGEPVLYAIRGNNDLATSLPDELVVEMGGRRMYLSHGHRFGDLHPSHFRMALRAQELGCDVALYGHTHSADLDTDHGVVIVNPGSAGNYCRGGTARACVLEISDAGALNMRDYFDE